MSFPENPYNHTCWVVGEPTIGKGCWIGAFTLLDGSGGLTIGEGCEISSGAQILTHSSARRAVTGRAYNRVDRKPTSVGKHCFIGTNATILMGATVGDHCVIGAGAVVTEDMVIPPYSVAVGVPAKVVKKVAYPELAPPPPYRPFDPFTGPDC